MPNATKYVDNVNGNNANTGDSEAQAYADIPTAIAAISGGGNKIYVQSAGSNYSITSAISINVAGTSTDGPNVIEGYTTTPGARDGRPTITSATNSVTLFDVSVNHWRIRHIKFTHTATTRGIGVYVSGGGGSNVLVDDCLMDGCLNGVAIASGNFWIIYCSRTEVKNSTGIGFNFGTHNSCYCFHCMAYDNADTGFGGGTGAGNRYFYGCVSASNGGDGFNWSGSSHGRLAHFVGCTSANNTGDGFEFSTDSASLDMFRFVNNIAYGNGGYGLNIGGSTGTDTAAEVLYGLMLGYCNAFGSNTSGARDSTAPTLPGDVSLSADPFTNAASGDYSLNNTAGGGAACRAAGFPGAFPGGTTTGYLDIGATQHQDSGSGGGLVIPVTGRIVG